MHFREPLKGHGDNKFQCFCSMRLSQANLIIIFINGISECWLFSSQLNNNNNKKKKKSTA